MQVHAFLGINVCVYIYLYYYNAPVLKFEFYSQSVLPPGNAKSLLTVHTTSSDGCQQMDSPPLISRSLSRTRSLAGPRSFQTTPQAVALNILISQLRTQRLHPVASSCCWQREQSRHRWPSCRQPRASEAAATTARASPTTPKSKPSRVPPWSSLASKSMARQVLEMHGRANGLGDWVELAH
jgi:hypothetical protein